MLDCPVIALSPNGVPIEGSPFGKDMEPGCIDLGRAAAPGLNEANFRKLRSEGIAFDGNCCGLTACTERAAGRLEAWLTRALLFTLIVTFQFLTC
jgi:hypothetical protein